MFLLYVSPHIAFVVGFVWLLFWWAGAHSNIRELP